MVLSVGCVNRVYKVPRTVYASDVPEVKIPKKPPEDGNVRDYQLYCGKTTLELERLREQIKRYKKMLKRGTF
jgi:hypothetical protein